VRREIAVYLDEDVADEGDYYWMIKNTVVPRPIAWVSTQTVDGRFNVAPYSFFNLVTLDPAIVEVCFGGPRDTLDNIRATGEFVVNLVSEGLVERETITAAIVPAHVDEAQLAGLTLADSQKIGVPRIADARVALECVFDSEIDVHGTTMVFGRVVGVYVRDDILAPNGRPDYAKYRPVGRMGGSGYSVVREFFEVKVPVFPHLLETAEDIAAVTAEAPGSGLGRSATIGD
jgi:flavin reductase (DIM6/NTAB) family NADH-FMN oxidoreductase RutF